MNYFCDISHYQGDIDLSVLAALGHKLVIIKASDNYYMPTKENVYIYDEAHHIDAYFVDNVNKAIANNILYAGYHFVRFTKAYKQNFTREQIIAKNLQYYQEALAPLPIERIPKTAVLDVEQNPEQLIDAGLHQVDVSAMAVALVDLYCDTFEHVIWYGGSWWSDQWIDPGDMAYIASKVSVWEPEYYGALITDSNGNTIGVNDGGRMPTVPDGFAAEFATDENVIGKLFAHQFTAKAHFNGIAGSVDLNRTGLSDASLVKLFGTDEPGDPGDPGDPGNGDDMSEEILAKLEELEAKLDAYAAKGKTFAIGVADLIYDMFGINIPIPPDDDPDDDPPDDDPPDDNPSDTSLWSKNDPKPWPTSINGIPVSYLQISSAEAKAPLYLSDGKGNTVTSVVQAWGSGDAARTIAKPGDIIMVWRGGKNTKYTEIFGKSTLEFIENIREPYAPSSSYQLGGGDLGWWVMWEQVIDGHLIAEHPHRSEPLFLRAKFVGRVIDPLA